MTPWNILRKKKQKNTEKIFKNRPRQGMSRQLCCLPSQLLRHDQQMAVLIGSHKWFSSKLNPLEKLVVWLFVCLFDWFCRCVFSCTFLSKWHANNKMPIKNQFSKNLSSICQTCFRPTFSRILPPFEMPAAEREVVHPNQQSSIYHTRSIRYLCIYIYIDIYIYICVCVWFFDRGRERVRREKSAHIYMHVGIFSIHVFQCLYIYISTYNFNISVYICMSYVHVCVCLMVRIQNVTQKHTTAQKKNTVLRTGSTFITPSPFCWKRLPTATSRWQPHPLGANPSASRN